MMFQKKNLLKTVIKQKYNKMLNLLKKIKGDKDQKGFLEKFISFIFYAFNSINNFGEIISNRILTIETQDKLNDLGHFRGFKRSASLFWVIVIATITILIWSIFAKTDQVIRANGTVIPASKIQLVQSVYGGVIDAININLSDNVGVGDILFEIDKNQNSINYQTTKEEVLARERKVKIFEELLANGAEAEMTLINERLNLAEAQRRLVDFEKRYDNSLVKSPVDGIISKVHVQTIGQVTSPGTLLAEIVPKGEDLIIEAQVLPKDISKVEIGQKAKIAFTAYDSAVWGMFEGVVENVSANTTFQEESNTVFYVARIIVTDDIVNSNDKIIIQSGMQSMVSIIGNKQTVISYFLNPIKKLGQRAFGE